MSLQDIAERAIIRVPSRFATVLFLAFLVMSAIEADASEATPSVSNASGGELGGLKCSKKIAHCKTCLAQFKGCAVCKDGYVAANRGAKTFCKLSRCGRSFTCRNGGVCEDSTCVCADGWSGNNCDVGLDVCDPNPCRNGGDCTANKDQAYTCLCAAGFSGMKCELGSHCQLTSIFCDDFSRGNALGWTLGPEWQIGTAVASIDQAYFSPDPSYSPSPGNAVAGVNIGGSAARILHDYCYMTSPAFDCSSCKAPQLTFIRWLNSDMKPWMQNSVEVFDGNSWIVLDESRNYITDDRWVYQTFDVTPYRNDAMRVRFGLKVGKTAGAFAVSSWNLARVHVSERVSYAPGQSDQMVPMSSDTRRNGFSSEVARMP